jgi:hypothetical protein
MRNQFSRRKLAILETDLQALRLRLEGCTFQQISDCLHFRHRASAWKAIRRAKLDRLVELAQLVQRLGVADAQWQFATIERRSKALHERVGVRRGTTRSSSVPKGGSNGTPDATAG